MTSTGKPRRRDYAVITGASHGIGLELARVFARNGFNLVLVARHQERLESVARDISRDYGVDCRFIPADLSLLSGVEEVHRRTTEDNLSVSVLVNNAGVGSHGPFCQTDFATQTQVISLNVVGLTYMTRLFSDEMVRNGSGKILNVASIVGFWPLPGMSVYAATKAYVISFSQTLASELKGTGVSVSVLCPGSVETGFLNGGHKELEDCHCGPVARLLVHIRYMDAAAVATIAYRGLMKNKRVITPGAFTRMLKIAMDFVPQGPIADYRAGSHSRDSRSRPQVLVPGLHHRQRTLPR